MVQEVRKIILSQTELEKALNSFRRLKPDFLPPGRISYCKPVENGAPLVGIEMKYGTSTHELEFALTKDDFLEVLIKFCLENNIPLPRKGDKAAGFSDGNATLYIQLEVELG